MLITQRQEINKVWEYLSIIYSIKSSSSNTIFQYFTFSNEVVKNIILYSPYQLLRRQPLLAFGSGSAFHLKRQYVTEFVKSKVFSSRKQTSCCYIIETSCFAASLQRLCRYWGLEGALPLPNIYILMTFILIFEKIFQNC